MPSPHTVVFCGTPEFAVPALEALARDGRFAVAIVVTQPDRPTGRKQTRTPPPVKAAAEALGLAVFQPEKVNAKLQAELQQRGIGRPDFLVVVAYGAILSRAVLDLPTIASVNIHGSLLPRWRGASPIEHAILAGDAETGVTIQVMVEELDAGPVLAQARTPIARGDTAASLRQRLAPMGASLLVDTLGKALKPVPQLTEGVTICRKLTRAHGVINNLPAIEAERAVRAFTPWPGATLTLKDGAELKILRASLTPSPGSCPCSMQDGSVLHLVSVQPAGKRPMSGADWARGLRA